jgi:hypothetical protein
MVIGKEDVIMRRAYPLSLCLAALLAVAVAAGDRSPSREARAILDKAKQLELYSLEPDEKEAAVNPNGGFHGWKILGMTVVKDAGDRKKLLGAFYKGLKDSKGDMAKCFNPRHGIRAAAGGKSVDAVICFECLQVIYFVDGKQTRDTLTETPQRVFDEVLKKAKVPLAPGPAR